MINLKDKLNNIKNTVIDYADDCSKTMKFTANEYAEYYGESYVKLLKEIKKQFFAQYCEENNVIDQEDINNEVKPEYTAEFKIAVHKGNNITFANKGFGKKEVYNLDIIKTLFYKAKYKMTINKEEHILKVTEDKTERLSEKFDKLYKNKDEYVSKAKDIVTDYEDKARDKTKKLINNLSDWANKNL